EHGDMVAPGGRRDRIRSRRRPWWGQGGGATVDRVTDEQRPYGGSDSNPALKRVRTRHFQRAKEQGIKITGLTSYDYLSASIFDEAGIDFLLVGDSAGNTVFGYDTTIPVTLDELIPLTRAVV